MVLPTLSTTRLGDGRGNEVGRLDRDASSDPTFRWRTTPNPTEVGPQSDVLCSPRRPPDLTMTERERTEVDVLCRVDRSLSLQLVVTLLFDGVHTESDRSRTAIQCPLNTPLPTGLNHDGTEANRGDVLCRLVLPRSYCSFSSLPRLPRRSPDFPEEFFSPV